MNMPAQEANSTGASGPNGARRKRTLIVLAVLMAAILVYALLWWSNNHNIIKTDNAKVTGNIIDVSSRIAGTLDSLAIEEHDYVKKGQLLAQLDSIPYQNALTQSQAGLETAQANYAKLPNDIQSMYSQLIRAEEAVRTAQAGVKAKTIACNDARRTAEHGELLYKQGGISREDLELVRSRLAAAEAALEAAEAEAASARAALADAESKRESMQKTGSITYLAQLKQAQAGLETAKYNLDQSSIKAPSDGMVLRIAAQEGENVSSGQTVVTICDLKKTWVVANIEEKKIDRIKVGQRVDVHIDAYPDEVFTGKVTAIGGAAQSVFALIPSESTSGNYTKVIQRIPIKIQVETKSVLLKPGLSAQIEIHTGNREKH